MVVRGSFLANTRCLTLLKNCVGFVFSDKRGIDGRLASAQTALMLQEETIRRNERDRKAMQDKISGLERSIVAKESENRQSQVRY